MADWIPVVPARGRAVAASGLSYTVFFFSSIELARAVRQPGPCVRVNFSKLLRCCPRTWLRWNDPSRTRRTQEVPFIASCSHFIHGKTQGFVLRLRPQNKVHATFMQPLQCDLHPHVAKHQRRTDYALKRSKPRPPHTGGTFHRQLQPLDTEKHKVSCSGFLPKTKPMQPFQFVLQQHVHIHSLQCDLHPRVAEHQGRTDIKWWWQTDKCQNGPKQKIDQCRYVWCYGPKAFTFVVWAEMLTTEKKWTP